MARECHSRPLLPFAPLRLRSPIQSYDYGSVGSLQRRFRGCHSYRMENIHYKLQCRIETVDSEGELR